MNCTTVILFSPTVRAWVAKNLAGLRGQHGRLA
jgi:hypothetical protein